MELGFVKDMFDTIAPRYDFLNRLLSLRQDVYWRRKMTRALVLPPGGGAVLDAACGTGDVMIDLLKNRTPDRVVGVDFAPAMLQIARQKLSNLQPRGETALVAGNTLKLPFARESFDAITIAFGIRNIMDREGALRVFHEHLKPGGMLAVLELTTPRHPFLRGFYLAYFEKLLPAIGGFFSNNPRAYRYLPASVIRFPAPRRFARLMRNAGFEEVRWLSLTMGLAALHTGVKRNSSPL